MNAHLIIMQAAKNAVVVVVATNLYGMPSIFLFAHSPAVYFIYESRKTFTLFYAYDRVCIMLRHLTFPDRVLLLIAIDHIVYCWYLQRKLAICMTQIKQCICMRSQVHILSRIRSCHSSKIHSHNYTYQHMLAHHLQYPIKRSHANFARLYFLLLSIYYRISKMSLALNYVRIGLSWYCFLSSSD